MLGFTGDLDDLDVPEVDLDDLDALADYDAAMADDADLGGDLDDLDLSGSLDIAAHDDYADEREV